MLDIIGKLLNAIDEGRWSDAAAYARQLLKQSGNTAPPNAVTDSANSAADWIQNKTGFDPVVLGKPLLAGLAVMLLNTGSLLNDLRLLKPELNCWAGWRQ